jgi:hypothetical protein
MGSLPIPEKSDYIFKWLDKQLPCGIASVDSQTGLPANPPGLETASCREIHLQPRFELKYLNQLGNHKWIMYSSRIQSWHLVVNLVATFTGTDCVLREGWSLVGSGQKKILAFHYWV